MHKMPKLNVNMLALVFLFIDNEKTSRKSYNNRDKIGNTILNMLFNGENGIKNIENEIKY